MLVTGAMNHSEIFPAKTRADRQSGRGLPCVGDEKCRLIVVIVADRLRRAERRFHGFPCKMTFGVYCNRIEVQDSIYKSLSVQESRFGNFMRPDCTIVP